LVSHKNGFGNQLVLSEQRNRGLAEKHGSDKASLPHIFGLEHAGTFVAGQIGVNQYRDVIRNVASCGTIEQRRAQVEPSVATC